MLAAACGTVAVDDPASLESTSTTSLVTTTSSEPPITTTTAAPDPCDGEPLSIDERGSTRLTAGCRYRTSEFILFPIEFVVSDDRWLAFDRDDRRLVFVGIDADGDGGADADVAFLVWTPDGVAGDQVTPVSVIGGLEAIEGLTAASEPRDATVAGRAATTVDVDAGEDPISTGFRPCSTSGLDFSSDEPGFQLITVDGTGKGDVGFPACGRTRVWIVETADRRIVVLAAPNERDRFDEFMPMFDEFLENSVTFGTAGG